MYVYMTYYYFEMQYLKVWVHFFVATENLFFKLRQSCKKKNIDNYHRTIDRGYVFQKLKHYNVPCL